jgi:hypothetical protein
MLSSAGIEAIILNVTANVLTSFLALALKGGRKLLSQRKPSHVRPLSAAIQQTSDTFQWTGPGDLEVVCLFLQSPETEATIRQIYASKLFESPPTQLSDIQTEFIVSLAMFLGVAQEKLEEQAQQLFRTLLGNCERQLDSAIENGLLLAHEAKSALRHHILQGELAAIRKNIDFLTGNRRPSVKDVLEFEGKYRQQVRQRHADIVPPNFDSARRVPIDDIYVAPQFLKFGPEKAEMNRALNASDLLPMLKRAVLLGNPGGGKSTFVQKIVHDLAANYPERIIAGRSLTPLLIVLRDYGTLKKSKQCSILQFIELTATSTYQLQPPLEAIEYLLLSGRATVIFDGLDELLDTSYRQEITRDIEGFCNLYPSAPVLVTSREVGYEQAPLDPTFTTYLLQPFTDPQVQEYVRKWFATDQDLTQQQRTEKARAFFQESRIVADLCSNPLMLSLMCNIYRGENYIPSNRPEVYEKCALMLFDRWDKTRGIRTPLPIDQHIRPAMMYLAHWIYSNDSLQSGVTEKRLITEATNYLCPRRFEEREEAEQAAEKFISFCRGRAWVFTDTGTMREGERLYQFTHRTFLEYFTAAHLVRTHATPAELLAILLPRIIAREWDVVAQLAFQIQNRNIDSAGDQLLEALVHNSTNGNTAKSWNLLSFASRCLEFLVPSPSITRELTTTVLKQIIEGAQQQSSQKRESAIELELLSGLLNASAENRNVVATTIETELNRCIVGDDAQVAPIAGEIALHLNLALHHRPVPVQRKSQPIPARAPQLTVQQFWRGISERIFASNWQRIEALCVVSPILAYDAYRRGKLSLKAVLDLHGTDLIFHSVRYRAFRNVSMGALVDNLLPALRGAIGDRQRTDSELKNIGEWLLRKTPPWTRSRYMNVQFAFPHFGVFPGFQHPQARRAPPIPERDSGATFGALCILAVIFEGIEVRKSDIMQIVEKLTGHPEERLFRVLVGRIDPAQRATASARLQEFALSTDQRQLIEKWLNHEVNFVSTAAPRQIAIAGRPI